MNVVLAIFIGGGLGSLARFGISSFIMSRHITQFPIATLVSNFLSCCVLGILVGFFHERLMSSDVLKGMVLIGFCGGFSTFSAFSYETFELIKSGYYMYATANVVVSIAICLFVLFLLIRHA